MRSGIRSGIRSIRTFSEDPSIGEREFEKRAGLSTVDGETVAAAALVVANSSANTPLIAASGNIDDVVAQVDRVADTRARVEKVYEFGARAVLSVKEIKLGPQMGNGCQDSLGAAHDA